jgi:CelD/BcsL family acetyltransferase involved in cellulose biosynthesis
VSTGAAFSLAGERLGFVIVDELLIIDSAAGLFQLDDAWTALAERCPGYYLSQTCLWARTAWETVAQPLGRQLACLAIWSADRLVAIWPLVVQRDGALKIVRPLGFEGTEYCLPLVEPDARAPRRIARLWRAARALSDLALLPQVRTESMLRTVLRKETWWRAIYGAEDMRYVTRAAYNDWSAYRGTLSAKLRYEIRRGWQRLEARGAVSVHIAEQTEIVVLVDWLLDQKRKWLAQKSARSAWLGEDTYRNFLGSLLARRDSTGGALLFVLKVNGAPIAASFVSVDRTRVEGYVAGYDPAWRECSPGNVLTEHVIRWAFERNLDVDFRIGDEAYKRRWTQRNGGTATWLVATSLRGVPPVARLMLRLIVNRVERWLTSSRAPSAS